MKLYRYRNIEHALIEIKNGTFYFASREELNDPIEGYVKLYFQDDQATWEGLLKNYVCSLFVCIESHLISPTMDLDALKTHTVVVDLHRFDNVLLGRILTNLSTKFLNDNTVKKLVKAYGDAELKCSAKELQLILRVVQSTAFNICVQHFQTSGIVSNFQEMKTARNFPFEIIKELNENDRAIAANIAENQIADIMEEMIFNAKLRQEGMPSKESFSHKRFITWDTVRVDFPKLYVEQLQNLIYPEGYVVCFSATPTNSSMWGNYAQNHKGTCFIYESQNIDSKEYISLKKHV